MLHIVGGRHYNTIPCTAVLLCCVSILSVCSPSDNVVLKNTKEQKVKHSPEQKRGSIIRQIETDVTHMKTTSINIPPSHIIFIIIIMLAFRQNSVDAILI